MPKICENCQEEFPFLVKIDGKTRNLSSRKYCTKCSPFRGRNTRPISPSRGRGGLKGTRLTCQGCGEEYIYRRSGDTTKMCSKCYYKKSNPRIKRKKRIIEYKGGGCVLCGYNKCDAALELHHLDPGSKEFSISANTRIAWDELIEELDKCILLCSNCHREVHAGIAVV